MAVHEQPAPARSAFQPAPTLLQPDAAHAAAPAAPAAVGVSGAVAPQAPRIELDSSVFSHMADVLTVGGVPVASTAGPAAGQVTAPTTAPVAAPVAAAQVGGQVATQVGATPTNAPAPPTVAAYGATLDTQLDASIQQNRTTRTALDAERHVGLATADATETGLNGSRQQLLDQLNQRSGVFDHDIAAIDAQLGNQTPQHPTPAQAALIAQRAQLLASRNKYSDQQTSLSRWHDRNEINDINTQLANTSLTPEQRTALLTHKRTLATGLLSTVKHYEQFDDRWGSTTYGPNRHFSSMTDGGCGPTALADIMDFRDQEDPEGRHSRGEHDPYTPRVMANYASTHGRIRGQGTDGGQMMGDLAGSFPGVRGNSLGDGDNLRATNESLNNGIPVLFSGHHLNGTQANGRAAREYGAHFMVLNGISADGNTYNVQDGGRNQAANIHTMSAAQVGNVGNLYNLQDAPHPAARPNS